MSKEDKSRTGRFIVRRRTTQSELLMFILGGLVVTWSCQSEQERLYRIALETGTREVFTTFLDSFPNHRLADSARLKVQTLDFAKAKDAGTLSAYLDFLDSVPEGPAARWARNAIDSINPRSPQPFHDYPRYLRHDPGGTHAVWMTTRMQQLRVQARYHVDVGRGQRQCALLREEHSGLSYLLIDGQLSLQPQSFQDAFSRLLEALDAGISETTFTVVNMLACGVERNRGSRHTFVGSVYLDVMFPMMANRIAVPWLGTVGEGPNLLRQALMEMIEDTAPYVDSESLDDFFEKVSAWSN